MDAREWARARRAEIEAAHPGTAAAADEITRLRRLEADGDELAYDLSVARGSGDLSACERISADIELRGALEAARAEAQYLRNRVEQLNGALRTRAGRDSRDVEAGGNA